MAKKTNVGEKACGLRSRDSDDGMDSDERVIDPYDYRYRVYLFGEDNSEYDSDETEYKEP